MNWKHLFIGSITILFLLIAPISFAQEEEPDDTIADETPAEATEEEILEIPIVCNDASFAQYFPGMTTDQQVFEVMMQSISTHVTELEKIKIAVESVPTGYAERAYVWTRGRLTFDEQLNSFREMKHSACIRADLRQIDTALNSFQKLINQKLANPDVTGYKDALSTLRQQRDIFARCAVIPGTKYYEPEYDASKSTCEGEEEAMFQYTRNTFEELQDKLKDLSWEGVTNTEGWKNLGSAEKQQQLNAQAQAQAEQWWQRNNPVTVLGIEKFFTSGIRESEEVGKQIENAGENAETKKGQEQSNTIDTEQLLRDALRQIQALNTQAKQYVGDTVEQIFRTVEGAYREGAAELWAEEVRRMQDSVELQADHLKKLESALQSFVNHQAQNQGG